MSHELTAASPYDPPRHRYTLTKRDCTCRLDGPGGLVLSVHPERPELQLWVVCQFCGGSGVRTKEVRNYD